MVTKRIVCAANKFYLPNNEVLIVCSPRHYDMTMHQTLNAIDDRTRWDSYKEEQGFVDQFGTFHTREEAWVIANEANQIIRRVGGDNGRLYSENLY